MLTNTVCIIKENEVETHEHVELGRFTRSFGLSFAITSIFSALLVLLKESNEDTVMAWMTVATGHHWVTHGLLNLVVFVGLGLLLARPSCGDGVRITARNLVACIVGSLVVSWVIIAGFYLI